MNLLAAYGTFYDSMMAYFARWYVERVNQRRAAANAISLLLIFNVVSIANLLDAFGTTSVDLAADSAVVVVALFLGLVIANRRFAEWRGSISVGPCVESPAVSSRYAVRYMIASIATLVVSFALLVLMA